MLGERKIKADSFTGYVLYKPLFLRPAISTTTTVTTTTVFAHSVSHRQ
nr:MAG TPA: hypothetical protein [Caudoviricetes sp.]